MTAETAVALPTPPVVDEALGALAEIFDALPVELRAKHEGNRREVLRVLERLRVYLVSLGSGGAKEPMAEPTTTEGLAVVGGGLSLVSAKEPTEKEAAEMIPLVVKAILDAVRKLTDEQRMTLFESLDGVYCACGHFFASERDAKKHTATCPEMEEDDDDEDEESD